MLSVFDIGNSNINIGLFEDEKLVFTTKLATDRVRTAEQYALEIHSLFAIAGYNTKQIDGAVVSSVVPEITHSIASAVNYLTGINAVILGPGVKNGLDIKIDNPAQLGADLVAGAVAAVNKYPLPCLVMDLGTATKISVLDEKGAYRGCTIAAGVGVSMKALSGTASLLSSVDMPTGECPPYGTNTVASMHAGFIMGTAAMLDGMSDRIEQSLGVKIASRVATGGFAKDVVRYCRQDVTVEPDLNLDGLRIIYEKNKKK